MLGAGWWELGGVRALAACSHSKPAGLMLAGGCLPLVALSPEVALRAVTAQRLGLDLRLGSGIRKWQHAIIQDQAGLAQRHALATHSSSLL